ncbi:hypothetical protein GE09DRAFT_187974 [Coniochaeta sp. 2T2.1]|nr:hypothetical protein GE09DRAFT_187974 [Coniochaeta sp. 2T2.1]
MPMLHRVISFSQPTVILAAVRTGTWFGDPTHRTILSSIGPLACRISRDIDRAANRMTPQQRHRCRTGFRLDGHFAMWLCGFPMCVGSQIVTGSRRPCFGEQCKPGWPVLATSPDAMPAHRHVRVVDIGISICLHRIVLLSVLPSRQAVAQSRLGTDSTVTYGFVSEDANLNACDRRGRASSDCPDLTSIGRSCNAKVCKTLKRH